MKKKFGYIIILLFLGIVLLFAIPVPQKNFTELFDGKADLQTSLLSFRDIPTHTITINRVPWEYISVGQGESHLLFLHGMGGAYDIWWQQIEKLKGRFHVISTTLPEVHSIDEAVEGLKAILEQEGATKVSIIGSSMGGYMAQYFLKKYPERLNKIVLGNTFPPNDIYKNENGGMRKVLPFIPEWFIMKKFRDDLSVRVTPFSENSSLVEAYLLEQYSGKMKKGQFIGRLDVVLDSFEPGLSTTHKAIPKLIIESDNDPLVPPILRKQLKEQYPEAGVYTFGEKGHFPYLNAAETYTKVLEDFFRDSNAEANEVSH